MIKFSILFHSLEGEEKSDNDLKIENTEETVDKTGDVDHDNRVGSREVREGDWTCSSCKVICRKTQSVPPPEKTQGWISLSFLCNCFVFGLVL